MYIYICTYIYIYMYMYVYVYIYVWTYIYIILDMYIYVCVYIYIHIYIICINIYCCLVQHYPFISPHFNLARRSIFISAHSTLHSQRNLQNWRYLDAGAISTGKVVDIFFHWVSVVLSRQKLVHRSIYVCKSYMYMSVSVEPISHAQPVVATTQSKHFRAFFLSLHTVLRQQSGLLLFRDDLKRQWHGEIGSVSGTWWNGNDMVPTTQRQRAKNDTPMTWRQWPSACWTCHWCHVIGVAKSVLSHFRDDLNGQGHGWASQAPGVVTRLPPLLWSPTRILISYEVATIVDSLEYHVSFAKEVFAKETWFFLEPTCRRCESILVFDLLLAFPSTTGWRRSIRCFILAGQCLPKSTVISGSFAESDPPF